MPAASINTTALEVAIGWLLVGQARKSQGIDAYNAARVKNGKAAITDVSQIEIRDHNTAAASVAAVIAAITAAS
ncbi:hypothetical protein [Streptomyces virginiae]|uniref:hypothetical protein n=1 Tax=Streptomyces virginiae TaxID=1961 RepID=UPI002258B582|nr:hypothetical protein [Streptomyces virginiae]MCX4962978.1 hypothetical protein [Streptomyces virginiae]